MFLLPGTSYFLPACDMGGEVKAYSMLIELNQHSIATTLIASHHQLLIKCYNRIIEVGILSISSRSISDVWPILNYSHRPK